MTQDERNTITTAASEFSFYLRAINEFLAGNADKTILESVVKLAPDFIESLNKIACWE